MNIRSTVGPVEFGSGGSLDGYIDHTEFSPDPVLFRHFIEHARGLAGSVYGRRMYEVMRYWDKDRTEWAAEEREFAVACTFPLDGAASWRGSPARPRRVSPIMLQ